jgi:hypothetical protein
MRSLLRIAGVLWASPYTLVGLLIGIVGLCTGGRARIRGRAIEFYGGAVQRLLKRLPGGPFVVAMTLGHSILGQTGASLDLSRDHELVHVRQYEVWGPLFGPAYLLCGLITWIRGKNVWRDNPFERQAYEETGGD